MIKADKLKPFRSFSNASNFRESIGAVVPSIMRFDLPGVAFSVAQGPYERVLLIPFRNPSPGSLQVEGTYPNPSSIKSLDRRTAPSPAT